VPAFPGRVSYNELRRAGHKAGQRWRKGRADFATGPESAGDWRSLAPAASVARRDCAQDAIRSGRLSKPRPTPHVSAEVMVYEIPACAAPARSLHGEEGDGSSPSEGLGHAKGPDSEHLKVGRPVRDAAHRFTTAVGADVAAVAPPPLVAVTCERRRWPTSALPMPYDGEVAPLIGVQAFPFESHLSHW
jgi:hypothetical protein